ncbi:hypothetical protein SpyM6JRS4_07310 [Streptococcus pyogenes JRS4]|uniref:Phage protein n=2 Tax=Streptococcus TaxID=1301 RepID=A0A8B6IYX4_STRPY|nr:MULTISPECIES: hypothetical protein [Streptococcus]QBX15199.1 hypothetical protein Javan177_0013 [Streptococcus phage Javan177]QBX15370.1 hypothetical protein Javan183_0041 [Streptococcus phage Javan183]QBX15395.1 hypothetical protein Javan185_0013 [Streptococcus phage Javan185]QBX15491.1 hypothetical protein Javan189_0013 [Streptococcus phage Javan189]QBX19024.1 hypothetical protein Javan465_0011 [Streptococcus phage Javan465]QBX24361.1 hypothetical protein Javan184_0042 [Streptococcus pha
MEGLEYKQLAERENLSELSLKLRYTLNAKKVDVGKLKYDKHRLTIKRSYQKASRSQADSDSSIVERIQMLNNHFQNR